MAKRKKRIIDDSVAVASASDFTESNFLLLDGTEGSKKVPMNLILTEQLQTDWNERDSESPAFLKNKPVIVDPATVIDNASYDQNTKNILFKRGNSTLFTLNATAFVKDGMVDAVEIVNGYLVITFNTDAGKQPISIAISDIFNPSDYYTRIESDNRYATAAQGALADSAYQLPSSGIPKDSLETSVQFSLDAADNAYQKPSTGIPKSDLEESVQTSLETADSAYQLPDAGIPKADLASGVRSSLDAADTAYQRPGTGIPKTDLDTAVQTSLTAADTAYQLPAGGIPKASLDSTVQASLEKADTALQSVPVFSGADPGLVPSATSADASKLLGGDGTWAEVDVYTQAYIDSLPWMSGNSVVIGGREYPVVQIGNQLWLAENLDYNFTKTDTNGSWHYYDDNETTYGWNGRKCGLLYNWYAVKDLNDNRSTLLPDGWHVPDGTEWNTLIVLCGGDSVAGAQLKASNVSWAPNWSGLDTYGFNALPTGQYCTVNTPPSIGMGTQANFWTPDLIGSDGFFYYMTTDSRITRTDVDKAIYYYSVRLVKTLT